MNAPLFSSKDLDGFSGKSIWAVIPAAGIGSRMEMDIPKQYAPLLPGKTVLELTIEKILALPFVCGIVVAIHPDDRNWNNLSLGASPNIHTVIGGDSRQESVASALEYLSHLGPVTNNAWVLVHDAARPCVNPLKIWELCALSVKDKCGAILASRVTDTVKKSVDGVKILNTQKRDDLWLAHTPQVFPLMDLIECFHWIALHHIQFTDESSAMESFGQEVAIVEDDSNNIKITLPGDLKLAQFILGCQYKLS